MYKQIVKGIQRPAIFGVLIFMVSLLFISFLELIWKTEYASFWYYLVLCVAYVAACLFLWIITYVKYEYALLGTELIVRKYVAKHAVRIFSIKLTRSNCVYYNMYDRFFSPVLSNTHRMYLPGMLLKKTAVLIFVEPESAKRTKIIFKPDEKLDSAICNVKTMEV